MTRTKCLRYLATLVFVVASSTMLSCSKKTKKKVITITGSLKVPDQIKQEGSQQGTVVLGVSDAPFHELLDDPIANTKQFVATQDLTNYKIELDTRVFGNGTKDLQIFAFMDRDFSPRKAPKVTKGDLIGFYVQDLKPGLRLDLSSNNSFVADIDLSRTSVGRKLDLEIENSDARTGAFQVGLYCGEIRSLSVSSFAMKDVAYIRPMEKAAATVKELYSFELFLNQEAEWCYVFGFHDANRNQTADPEEALGFFSDRPDDLPTQVNINTARIGPLNLKFKFKVPPKRDQPILVRGNVVVGKEIGPEVKRIFVIVAKYNAGSLNLENASREILGFAQISRQGGDFEVDLTQSAAEAGQPVTVYVLGDQDDRGIPKLNEGDALGLPLEGQTVLQRNLAFGINGGFNLKLSRKYFEGKSTLQVNMDHPFVGNVLVVAYGGEISFEQKEIDVEKVFGMSSFEKVDKKARVSVDVFGLGTRWPMDLYVFGVLDANRNMKADPGEEILLPLDSDGRPKKARVNRGEQTEFNLDYLYSLPIPSSFSIQIHGNLHLAKSELPRYIFVLVAQCDEIDQVILDPLKCVKAMQKVPVAARRYSISLTNTALKPGDRVQIMAVTSNEEELVPKLTDKSLVGFVVKDGKIGYTLRDGDNQGVDLIVDKTSFRDRISVVGILENDYRGKTIASLFAGNPIDLINKKYNFEDFVAISSGTKESQRYEVRITDLVTNKQLPIRGMVLLVEDANGNDVADPGEVIHFAYHETRPEPLFLDINLGDVYSFKFNHQTSLPIPSQSVVRIKGKVNVNASVEGSKIYVLVLNHSIESFSPSEIAQKIYAIQEVSYRQPDFAFDLGIVGKVPGEKVVIAALVDRDFKDFPRLSANDLVGFYSGVNAWSYELKEGEQGGIEINVDRPLYDGEAIVEGSIEVSIDESERKNLLAVVYAGPIDNLNSVNVDPKDILGFLKPGQISRFELNVTPIGYAFPVSAYLFLLNDRNGNQALDPGEILYYYSSRPDRIPERTTMNQGQRSFVKINQSLMVPEHKGQNIEVSGKISWLNGDLNDGQSAYLFIARAKDLESLKRDPLTTMRLLKKLDGKPTEFALNLRETDLSAGETVIVGAWIDKDKSQGPNIGDRIGIFQKGIDGFTFVLNAAGHRDIDIDVSLTLYDTEKTVDVAFLNSNYEGRVLAILYKGLMNGIDVDDLNFKDVVGFSDFQKKGSESSFKVSVLPTQQLPINNVTLVALLDANQNGKPDPGEEVVFSSAKANSFPKSLHLTSDFSGSVALNSPYRIQQPANQGITIEGLIDSVVANSSNYPITVAIFKETDLENLTREPLKYLKEYRVLPAGTSTISLPLGKTDLIEGQKIMLLAFQNPVSDQASQTQIMEGAMAGILLNTSTFSTSWTLTSGVNQINSNGYSLVIKRIYYDHLGRISELPIGGDLPFAPEDTLMIAAYKTNGRESTVTQLTNIDYDKVVAYAKFTKASPEIKYQLNIFQALVAGIVETNRVIEEVLIVGWRDTDRDGRLDEDEPIGFFCAEGTPIGPPSFVDLQLANNQIAGMIKFRGAAQTTNSLQNAIINDPLNLVVCQ